MDHIERLRRLAYHQLPADSRGSGATDDWLEPSLEPKTLALVRLAAIVAMGDGAGPSYGALTDQAIVAGASMDEIVDVLFGVLPVVGPLRVVAAAPGLALALGHDTDELPGAGS